MFKTIGSFAARYSWYIIGFWVVAAVVMTVVSPNLNDVVVDDTASFLPGDAEAIQGIELFEEQFPEQSTGESIVIVFDSGADGTFDSADGPNTPAEQYVAELTDWFASEDGPEEIATVTSVANTPGASDQLTAPNGSVQFMVVAFDVDVTNQDTQADVVALIDEQLDNAPDGLDTYQTGQVATFIDYNTIIEDNVAGTFTVTILLVAVILLTIFRSPVSPLIPLGIVSMAFAMAQSVVAIVGDNFLEVSSTATTLMIVVIYGAGTDYCLFLISRFREEYANTQDKAASTVSTVRNVGESIFNSAATTTTGFLAMSFTQFGLFNVTGPVLAIVIVLTLAVGITLTPAVLSLLGKGAFWPVRGDLSNSAGTGIYGYVARIIRKYNYQITFGMLALAVPLIIYGLQYESSYDVLVDLPADAESVVGFRILEDNIGAGEMQPVTLVAEVGTEDTLGQAAALTRDLQDMDGIAAVRSATQPLGGGNQLDGITRIDTQLNALAGVTAPPEGDAQAEPTDEQMEFVSNLLTDLPAYLEAATERQPQLDIVPVLSALEDSSEGISPDLSPALATLAEDAADAHLPLREVPAGVLAAFGGQQVAGLVDGFVNYDNGFVRYEIILDYGPYTAEAMDTVEEMNAMVGDNYGEYGTSGTTQISADIRDVIGSDLRLTVGLVLGGIFIVLIIMLRSLIAPLYLIGTIALSFTTTLGFTRIGSEILFGESQLIYWVPFFMFVFLVALGIDYSIYLFGRIKEEMLKGDVQDGIQNSVRATGSIITSAGVIVSGTFAALMSGDILGLQQIGFAVGAGILIDTVIIRTFFVPALASVVGKWSWWPGPIMDITGRPEDNPAAHDEQKRRTGEMPAAGTASGD
jgi:putative drug exporter of the RND superfamily